MQDEILNKIEESFLKAEKFYNRSFTRPKVIFKRNGTTAGYARRDLSYLMFQLDLAEANKEDFINQTVPHEVAHSVQFELYPRSSPHGREWKYIMRYVMGISPDRCHDYDVSVTNVKRQTRHLYTCGCGKEFNLSTTKHNRIQRGYQKRVCLSCRGILSLKKIGNPLEQKMTNLLQQLQAKASIKS